MALTKRIMQIPTAIGGALILQILLTSVAIFGIFKPWLIDWTVPLNYQGDTIFQLILVKSLANSSWTWFIPDLSAPMLGFNAVAFPQNITFSWALMKVMSFFTKEPGLILNLFWLSAIALTSVTCHIALRALQTPLWLTIPLATLYALLPYGLIRNTTHISLTYIFTPIIAAYAIAILGTNTKTKIYSSNDVVFWPPLFWVSCAAIGLDYIYNAFFSCCFLVMAAVLASLDQRNLKPMRQAYLAVFIIIAFTIVNLLPTLWVWAHSGMPPSMGYKSYADVEVYGLKIRHLLSSPAMMELSSWLKNLQYPLENENRSAMLGFLGGIGYIAALVFGILGYQEGSKRIWAAGALTIAGTLLGTIGGLGAILSYLIGPDIRAYNRVSPFLAFFSFFVLSHLICWLVHRIKSISSQYQIASVKINRFLILVFSIVFISALVDQSYAVKPLLNRFSTDQKQVEEEKHFIQSIENRLPHLTHFYQLPETPFPVDAGTQNMGPYDHGRPYLWSQHLKWSWPNFSVQGKMWLGKIGILESEQFFENLISSGFNAIWLDRRGYDQAALQLTENILASRLGQPILTSKNDRYAVYSLEPLLKSKNSTNSARMPPNPESPLLIPVGIDFSKGFYPQEFIEKDKVAHYWAKNEAEIKFINFTNVDQKVVFRSLLSYHAGGTLRIQIHHQIKTIELKPGQTQLAFPIELSPNSILTAKLKYDGIPIEAPKDPRKMYLSFTNPRIEIEK